MSRVVGVSSESNRTVHWVRTVGGPRRGDPHDGESHQFFGPLRDHFDPEPPDDGPTARYVRDPAEPTVEEHGRSIWNDKYQP